MSKIVVLGLATALITGFSCGPAAAWYHAGAYGTAHGGGGSWSASGYRGGSASGGGGSWSGSGYRGGTASGGGGSWHANGAYGGSASGGGGSWHANGAYGGSASGGGGSWHGTTSYGTSVYGGYGHYYGGSYSTYHPPTVVNYYGSGCGSCGGWNTAGAAAVGLAAGTALGAAATANAYNAGVAAGSAYAVGAIYPVLPAGCEHRPLLSLYECGGGVWLSPAYGANGIYYRVVPAP
jgi:hypothetical protein